MVTITLDASRAARLLVEMRLKAEQAERASYDSVSTNTAEHYAEVAAEWREIEAAIARGFAANIHKEAA